MRREPFTLWILVQQMEMLKFVECILTDDGFIKKFRLKNLTHFTNLNSLDTENKMVLQRSSDV